jgi:hypothetical protein
MPSNTHPPSKRRTGLFAKPIHEFVAEISKPAIAKKGFVHARLITHWSEIIGASMAEYCFPQEVTFPAGKRSNGLLTIATDSGHALEIQHLTPILLEKMAVYFGYRAIERIRIVQHGTIPPPSA